MADPGFPTAGRGEGALIPESKWSNLFFCKIVAENRMKMKEFGPTGGGGRPLDLPLLMRL